LIAIDTSSLRRYLSGEKGRDVTLVMAAIAEGRALLPPVVLCEAVSDPSLPSGLVDDISGLPVLELRDGFWNRAGILRARVTGRKAKLADVLIAQTCIDHRIPLVTNDRDFRHFVGHGLTLA
jgi:hypothetical protein